MLQPLRFAPRLLGLWLLFALLLTGGSGAAQTWEAATAVGTSELNGQSTGARTIADGSGGLYVTGTFQGVISLGGRTLRSEGYTSFIARLDAANTSQWILTLPKVGPGNLAVDAAGDLYVAGNFYGPSITLGSTTLTSTSTSLYGSDLFVAKLSRAGQWLWAYQASGPGSKQASNLALDASGNVYVTGNFGSGATFGTTTLTYTTGDIFVAKLTPAGQWQWAMKAGSNKANYVTGLKVDASGNTYVTGTFYGDEAVFGALSLPNTSTVGGSGLSDLFVAKLDPAGQWLWAVKAGGRDNEQASGLALDAAGNPYVAGQTQRGPVTFGSLALNSPDTNEAFVAKLNSAGQWQWVARAGGSDVETASDLTTDASGNAYLTGTSNSRRLTLGSVTLDKTGPQWATYVAKINAAGQWQWATENTGVGDASSSSIAVDAGNNVFLTGTFYEGTISFGSSALNSNGVADLFVAKLNSAGQWQWAGQGNGGGDAAVHATATDAAGNVYLAGSFTGTLAFGSTVLSSHNINELFVAKRNAAGQWLWITQAGGMASYGTAYFDDKHGLALDADGNVYVTGSFKGDATFGPSALSSIVGGYKGFDVFVAKLNGSGQWQWGRQAGGNNDDRGNGVAVDATGRVYVTGSFESATAGFGTSTLTNQNSFGGATFVAQLTSAGQWLWATTGGGNGAGLALDAAGGAYVTGPYATPTATFGTTTLTNPGSPSSYVAKISTAGQWQWATPATGGSVYARGIAADASGNAYVTGSFRTSATFGPTTFTSSDSSDIFVAKISRAGQWQWAAQGGMRGSNEGRAIAVGTDGSAYVTGNFRSAGAIFGSATLPYSRSSLYDSFVAKLTPAGQWQWAKSSGGTNFAHSLALDNAGTIYLGGEFAGRYGGIRATFGTLALTSPAAEHSVGFLARLNGTVTGNTQRAKTMTLAEAFPNPFAHQLTVQLLAPVAGVVDITAHDVTGRQWLHQQLTLRARQTALMLPEAARWPAGVYTLTVRQGQQQQVLKVIRQD
ncbi:T9SS type A sorting domain-containing protein [Hymenobacter aquaticus]|uniref:T9SS type A sorting domain-containing protein n=1 Tax=Hymenobacter aquaticus TaxID=1867101 RepID=A0A4Z0PRT1_9BACT|nr:SBBP repeat-containing protein [Hymenobacter aquaticus]TGE20368.1 T9SS type A sorting domain-containing protein [Hymenobacter aquaticus]